MPRFKVNGIAGFKRFMEWRVRHLGMTGNEVARRAGVSHDTVHKLMNNQARNCSLVTAVMILDVLGYDLVLEPRQEPV